MSQVLDTVPPSLVSEGTAEALAAAAYRHAAQLTPFGEDIVGVGCTCALATQRDRRGSNRVLAHMPEHFPFKCALLKRGRPNCARVFLGL